MSLASKLGNRFKAAFGAQIVTVLTGGILTVFLTRMLTPNGYGLLFLSMSIFGIAQLITESGVHRSAGRYIAEYKESDPGQIPHILRFSFLLNLTTIIVVVIGLLLTHHSIAALLGEPDLVPFLLIGSAFIAFSSLFAFGQLTLQGFEEIKQSSAVTAIKSGSRLLLVVVIVLLGYEAIGALTGYVLSMVLAAVASLYLVFKKGTSLSKATSIEPGLRRRIAEYTAPLTVTKSSHVIDQRIDTVLVGFFVGPVGVAYYTLGKQIVQFIETPMSALGFTLSPTFGSQKASGNADRAARIYEMALSNGLLLYLPAAAGLILVAEPAVELIFGTDYSGAVPVVQVFAIYAVSLSITKVTSHGLDYLGRARERAIVRGTTAVLNLGLNLILIPMMGVIGAAITTVITFSIYALFNIYIMHIELGLRVEWLLRQLGQAIAVTGVMSLVVFSTAGYITGFITLFAVVGFGAAVWGVLAILFGLVDVEKIVNTLS
ncbi:flippase [Natronobeatus ordinarius]|uniref:flippase n=1 Tax=Natronobeatus ordinarius TaxID=2963433 RepID=UPI0020CE8FDC|nr:flippase [Natronobeatus ordinarius]